MDSLLSSPVFWIICVAIVALLVKTGLTQQSEPTEQVAKPAKKEGGRREYDFASEDPDRWFSPDQRKNGHARAGNVCEYTHTKTGERCTNKSREADHFYPYSKGGTTTMQNLVAACTWHNQTKSARAWEHEKDAIETRRKTYFPESIPVMVGERKNTTDTPFEEPTSL